MQRKIGLGARTLGSRSWLGRSCGIPSTAQRFDGLLMASKGYIGPGVPSQCAAAGFSLAVCVLGELRSATVSADDLGCTLLPSGETAHAKLHSRIRQALCCFEGCCLDEGTPAHTTHAIEVA